MLSGKGFMGEMVNLPAPGTGFVKERGQLVKKGLAKFAWSSKSKIRSSIHLSEKIC